MQRFLRPALNIGAHVILDLEDGVGDVREPTGTPELKRIARDHLRTFAESLSSDSATQLGVRVNAMATEHFGLDLAMLGAIDTARRPRLIVVPKVNSGADLEAACEALNSIGSGTRQVVPIVESRAGLAHLDDIMSMAIRRELAYVVYGHYDYCLDAGEWPFPDHDQAAFWHIATDFIRRIERGGLSYVHPPFPHVRHDAMFRRIRDHLATICSRAFGMITVTSHQSSMCHDVARGDSFAEAISLDRPSAISLRDRLARAQSAITTYEANRRDGSTFALEARTGRFITVHEYLAAKRHVDASGG